MIQPPLPDEYLRLSDADACDRIAAAKAALGRRLVILGHHYQREDIIRHADFRGDSYKLCRDAASHAEADYIVFCGVHFMAESAEILSAEHQIVILPNLSAGCSMADMANIFQVRQAWKELGAVVDQSRVIPITYMNSSADLKAFVGEHGGAVCTSSNARKVIEWALTKGDRLLFFPDQHLGRNTACRMGFDVDRDMAVWDPFQPLGGLPAERIRDATVLLWKGHCSVHGRFTLKQVETARKVHPEINVIVHPECTKDVVDAADQFGSTEYISKVIREAPAGSKWAVGTEINLVKRLADEMPEKLIFCLDPIVCPCSTMYRISPTYLCWALENLMAGRVVNRIQVPAEVKRWALAALDRMIQITEQPVVAAVAG